MLLRFDAPDMLNTTLVDTFTGETAYTVTTVLASSQTSLCSPGAGPSSTTLTRPESKTTSACSQIKIRHTEIRDQDGILVADIRWNGRRPDITLGEERVGALTELFDTTTVKIVSNAALALPARFDSEYVWTATSSSLTLVDCRSGETHGTFHHNAIRIPASSATNKISPPSSPSTDRFINTHVPGFGYNYLDFNSHPSVKDVEIIVSFFMMEILRRGRFSLTPYTFERSKLWQLIETKDLIMRRIRRNTL